MDETWVRVALLGGALALAALVVLVLRRRDRRARARTSSGGLPVGVYFFSSATCDSCMTARVSLERIVGADGFTEFAWETTPDRFTELGVEAVPATLVVFAGEYSELHTGVPERLRVPEGP